MRIVQSNVNKNDMTTHQFSNVRMSQVTVPPLNIVDIQTHIELLHYIQGTVFRRLLLLYYGWRVWNNSNSANVEQREGERMNEIENIIQLDSFCKRYTNDINELNSRPSFAHE